MGNTFLLENQAQKYELLIGISLRKILNNKSIWSSADWTEKQTKNYLKTK